MRALHFRDVHACNADCHEGTSATPGQQVTCTAGRLRMFMARAPYVSVDSVSSAALAAGDTHATMSVSADPPSESMSRRVSIESRKGMCAPPPPPPLSASALITWQPCRLNKVIVYVYI